MHGVASPRCWPRSAARRRVRSPRSTSTSTVLDVPVYDNYLVAALASHFPLTPRERTLARPADADEENHLCCERFWKVYLAAQSCVTTPRIKVLDYMLWVRGVAILELSNATQ